MRLIAAVVILIVPRVVFADLPSSPPIPEESDTHSSGALPMTGDQPQPWHSMNSGALPTSDSIGFEASQPGTGPIGTPQEEPNDQAITSLVLATTGIGTIVLMGIPFGALLGVRKFDAEVRGSYRRPP
jgi:hypothetical protein